VNCPGQLYVSDLQEEDDLVDSVMMGQVRSAHSVGSFFFSFHFFILL